MVRRKVIFAPGEYYHIYNRGVEHRPIFLKEENYIFLLRRVKQRCAQFKIAIIAYVLMPNHYHFLVRQEGGKTVSQFVQAVFNSYTKAFNQMYRRSGRLFESPFRAVHVSCEDYLLHLCRYLHRNPLEAGLVNDPAAWPYSNYLEWIGQRDGTLVDRTFVQAYFPTPAEYKRFVLEYEPSNSMREAVQHLALE